MAEKAKRETWWYDPIIEIYQKMSPKDSRFTELRNFVWKSIEGLVVSQIKKFIDRKGTTLRRDPELCQKLYGEAYFIFLKACEKWNPIGVVDSEDKKHNPTGVIGANGTHKTTFMTFLWAIIDQELLNIVRLDWYYKNRNIKIARRLLSEGTAELKPEQERFEYNDLLADIKEFLENYSFESDLERDIIWTMIYGIPGDWKKLQQKSKVSPAAFSKARKKTVAKLKESILGHCTPKQKDVLRELLEER